MGRHPLDGRERAGFRRAMAKVRVQRTPVPTEQGGPSNSLCRDRPRQPIHTFPVPDPKSELRSQLRRTLARVGEEGWRAGSQAACARLLAQPLMRVASCAMLYVPIRNEVDVGPLAQSLLARGSYVCIPRTDWVAKTLTPTVVVQWPPPTAQDAQGAAEPLADAVPVPLERLNVVVVPGLGFSEDGARLGRGGGFYDRFLAQRGLTAVKVGLALDEQVVPQIPTDEWDVPVDAVCTPTRWLTPVHGR